MTKDFVPDITVSEHGGNEANANPQNESLATNPIQDVEIACPVEIEGKFFFVGSFKPDLRAIFGVVRTLQLIRAVNM